MSKRRVISQREARRTAKALKELRQKHDGLTSRYTSGYPGVRVRTIDSPGDATTAALKTAWGLGFGLAARITDSKIEFYAVRH